MASGGHRIMMQGEHYQNQDVHLTVACLRARRSQSSLQDVYYDGQLKSQNSKAHGMPKYSTSPLYSNKYKDMRCIIQEDKRELKRRLQHIQRCEAEAEVERQKMAETCSKRRKRRA